MKNRTIKYISKSKALKIFASPLETDLQTFLSATFKLSRSRVVRNHIQNTLHELTAMPYKLSA